MAYVVIDVDGTLASSNVSFLFGWFLWKRGVLPFYKAVFFAAIYFFYVAGFVSMQKLHQKVFSLFFKGQEFCIIDHEASLFFEEGCVHFRKEIVERLIQSQKRGDRVVLLSASPDFLIKKIAQKFLLKEWCGTEYLVEKNGCFSSLGKIISGEEKRGFVLSNRKAHEKIVVMTDSSQDVPLLRIADEVCAVFPDRKLKKIAQKNGWEIMT